jgi:fibronectin-binding autotransporter adhesin
MKSLNSLRLLAGFCALAPLHSYAVDGNWLVGSGSWSAASNWSSNPSLPGGVGSTVSLNANITSTSTVTLDINRTVGNLSLGDTNNSASYSVVATGGSVLTFDNGGAGASITNLVGSAGANLIFASVTMSLNDNLSLSNLASGARGLTINSAISAASVGTKTITNVGVGSATMTLGGAITNGSGTVAIVQDSATSTLILGGNSSAVGGYSGGLEIRQGTVIFGNNGSWGRGDVNIGSTSGSTAVTIDVSSARSITTTNTQRWNQNFTFVGSNSLNTGNGSVILSGNRQVTVSANVFTVGGGISDGGSGYSLIKAGSGTMALNAASTYTGATQVSAGTLLLGSGGSLASQSYVIGNGATFDVSAKSAYDLSSISGFSGITFQLDSISSGLFNAGTAALTLDDQLTLSFSTASLVAGTTYNLFDMGSQTGSFTSVVLDGSFSGALSLSGDLWTGASGGYGFSFDESTGVLTVSVVPEPAAVTLLGVGALALIGRRNRKSKESVR